MFFPSVAYGCGHVKIQNRQLEVAALVPAFLPLRDEQKKAADKSLSIISFF